MSNMKKYKYTTFVFAFVFFFLSPFAGFAQDSIKEELNLVIEKIQSMAKRKMSSNSTENPPLIVAVGGCPGVGKSTISKLLKTELAELGIVSVIVSLDHYGLSQEARKQFTSELDPRRIQWNKLHNTLTSICEGENEIVKPTIDQLTKEMSEETIQLKNVDCILFEGCYALGDSSPMDFMQYIDLAIYLETSLENIFDWKWQRELKKSSPRTPEAFFHHMMEIVKDFAFHVYPTRKNSDYLIRIDFFHHYSIIDSNAVKTRPEPDFTPLRLETLSY